MSKLYVDLGNDFSHFAAIVPPVPDAPAEEQADPQQSGGNDQIKLPARTPEPPSCHSLPSDQEANPDPEGPEPQKRGSVGQRPRRALIFRPTEAARRYVDQLGQGFDDAVQADLGASPTGHQDARLSGIERGGAPSTERRLPSLSALSAPRSRGAHGEIELELVDGPCSTTKLVTNLLLAVKRSSEDAIDHSIREAVIAVPSSLGIAARRNLQLAASTAGLTQLQTIDTEAIGLSMLADRRPELEGAVALTVDIGATAMRVQLQRRGEHDWQLLASDCETRVSGDAFDHKLLETIAPQLIRSVWGEEPAPSVGSQAQAAVWARALDAIRNARHDLDEAEQRTLHLPHIAADESGPKHFRCELSRDDFERSIADLLERLQDRVRRVLRRASVASGEVDEIILLGGATQSPAIRRAFQKLCANAQVSYFERAELAAAATQIFQSPPIVAGKNSEKPTTEASGEQARPGVESLLVRGLDLRTSSGEQQALLTPGRRLPAQALWQPTADDRESGGFELVQAAAQSELPPQAVARFTGSMPETRELWLELRASGQLVAEWRVPEETGSKRKRKSAKRKAEEAPISVELEWIGPDRLQLDWFSYREACEDFQRAEARSVAQVRRWLEESDRRVLAGIETLGDKLDQLVVTRLRAISERVRAKLAETDCGLEQLQAAGGEITEAIGSLHYATRAAFKLGELKLEPTLSEPQPPTEPEPTVEVTEPTDELAKEATDEQPIDETSEELTESSALEDDPDQQKVQANAEPSNGGTDDPEEVALVSEEPRTDEATAQTSDELSDETRDETSDELSDGAPDEATDELTESSAPVDDSDQQTVQPDADPSDERLEDSEEAARVSEEPSTDGEGPAVTTEANAEPADSTLKTTQNTAAGHSAHEQPDESNDDPEIPRTADVQAANDEKSSEHHAVEAPAESQPSQLVAETPTQQQSATSDPPHDTDISRDDANPPMPSENTGEASVEQPSDDQTPDGAAENGVADMLAHVAEGSAPAETVRETGLDQQNSGSDPGDGSRDAPVLPNTTGEAEPPAHEEPCQSAEQSSGELKHVAPAEDAMADSAPTPPATDAAEADIPVTISGTAPDSDKTTSSAESGGTGRLASAKNPGNSEFLASDADELGDSEETPTSKN